MFGDDFFGGGIEELFNRLSAGNNYVESTTIGPDGKRTITRKTQSGVFGKFLLDKVVTKKNIYFIFDFSNRKEIVADIKDEFVLNDYGEKLATGKKVLEVREGNKVISNFNLSENIKTKGFEFSFNNGILEVMFRK